MKRFIGIFTILIAVSIIGTFKYSTQAHIDEDEGTQSIHIDVVTYHNYDSEGNSLGISDPEYINGSTDTAIYWSYYDVYRITDADGETHELWVDCRYVTRVIETDEWTLTGGWTLPSQEVDAFFLAHISD